MNIAARVCCGFAHASALYMTASCIAVAIAVFAPSKSASAAASFHNQTITMIIASDAGGGTDLVGRLFAKYFEEYLPGRPSIVAKNMHHGAGKILAANHLARAKPDGLTVMQTDSDTLQPTLLKREAVRYEPMEFRVVGAISRGGSVVMIRKDAVARLKDPSAEPVRIGATSGERSWKAMLVWGKEYLGWNLTFIKGYQGSGPMRLALMRGEIDSFATNGIDVLLPLHKEGHIDFLVQEGNEHGDTFLPRESFKHVPVFPLLLREVMVPDVAFAAYKSIVGASDIDKWIALPPKTPDEIVAAYRLAFNKALENQDFLAAAHKRISEEIYPMTGEETEQKIRALRTMPGEVVKFAEELRQKFGLLPR